MTEALWQKALVRHLNRPHSGIRVWRQNAGRWQALRKGAYRLIVALLRSLRSPKKALEAVSDWVVGAPKGAADLVGLLAGGQHIEIECKVEEPWQPHQQKWAKHIERMGGIYVLARFNPALSLQDNVELVETALRAERRAAA